jgi:hypothetical protein
MEKRVFNFTVAKKRYVDLMGGRSNRPDNMYSVELHNYYFPMYIIRAIKLKVIGCKACVTYRERCK